MVTSKNNHLFDALPSDLLARRQKIYGERFYERDEYTQLKDRVEENKIRRLIEEESKHDRKLGNTN